MAVWVASTGHRRGPRRLPAPRRPVGRAREPRRRRSHCCWSQPRVAVQPNGEFVAVWVGSGDGDCPPLGAPSGGRRLERRRARSTAPAAAASPRCWRARTATVTLIDAGDGSASSYTKAPGADAFGAAEAVAQSAATTLAVAPTAASSRSAAASCCDVDALCVVAQRRPPGGAWADGDELVAGVPAGRRRQRRSRSTANPDASYTAVWAETPTRRGARAPGRGAQQRPRRGRRAARGRASAARRGRPERHRPAAAAASTWPRAPAARSWRCGSRAA